MRPVSLLYTTHKQLSDEPVKVAVLPWGATEAHNRHLPYGSDVLEAQSVAEDSALLAQSEGARVIVLPVVPFGNNAQQIDQAATIHFSTKTISAVLNDVVYSLKKQNIDRLLIVNSHGGNNFQSIVRDLREKYDVLIVVADLWKMIPDAVNEIFEDPGDHAGELETSFVMYILKNRINLEDAGDGKRVAFELKDLNQPGIWTPRPWSVSHPDLGSGNPAKASMEKGEKYYRELCNALKKVILSLSNARKGDIPYI